MGRIWVVDTDPHERFSLYTRGNVGEVFPHVISALTGSLIGDSVRQAQVDVFAKLGILVGREIEGPSVGRGVFGGYLYANASVMRLFGVRMPGMDAAAADEQVSGVVTDLPAYRRQRGDRSLRASLRIMRSTGRLLRRPDLTTVDAAQADAVAWLSTQPDVDTAPTAELLTWLRAFPARQGASMHRLLSEGMTSSAPRAVLDKLLDRPSMPQGLANRIVSGTGDVDSAQLAIRLWALARTVREEPELTAHFDEGLDRIAHRIEGTTLAVAVAAFLADHGHRCTDEYELATPSWSMDPAPVFAMIDRLRHADEDRDPVAAGARLRADADIALAEALAATPAVLRPIVRRVAA
ncbi:MAG: hypothetical protein Q8K72_17215, partial [Acidimicrobiales bacterium]|nr:hypothetical protein [Acidimicrobiales bacterium]